MVTKKRVDSWAVTDDFWQRFEPLIPVRERASDQTYLRKPGAGRPPKPARQVFEAVVYVLRTDCQWKATRQHNLRILSKYVPNVITPAKPQNV